MTAIGNFMILLCLFIYVYALLGMTFFAGTMKFDNSGNVDKVNGTSPPWNFDNLWTAVVVVFELLVEDNWNNTMYDAVLCNGWYAYPYFMSAIIFGNIVMLNLFLAVLLGNFDEASMMMKEKKYIEQKIRDRKANVIVAIDKADDVTKNIAEHLLKQPTIGKLGEKADIMEEDEEEKKL